MPKQEEEDKNSVCSLEEVEVKDKDADTEDAEEDENEDDEENEEEDDEEEEEEEDDEEYDPNIINYELLKNFFVDEEGNNVTSQLGLIAKELRTLNKILLKKNKD
jgi:TATA-binding protein-associated factor Taf7